MLSGISYLALGVRDFAACRAFYGHKVGLHEVAGGTTAGGIPSCALRVGRSTLELWEDPAAPVLHTPATGDPPQPPSQIGHYSFLARDNAEVFAALKDREIDPLWGPNVQPLDHAFMQRSLVEFRDPNGIIVQVSEIVDPRPHLEARRAAKRACIGVAGAGEMFPAFDHISMCCTHFEVTRAFYTQALGLPELVLRTTAEPGAELKPGFAQSVFAAGCTDIEMYSDAELLALQPNAARRLGFWSDDVEGIYRHLRQKGVALDGPLADTVLPSGEWRLAFTLRDPDGLAIQIVQEKG